LRIVIEWREREHGQVDDEVMDEPESQQALCRCGLYKFFCCNIIRAHQRLLETFIDYWELEANAFMIKGKSIKIEMKDIYFLTRLPHRGDVVNLKGK